MRVDTSQQAASGKPDNFAGEIDRDSTNAGAGADEGATESRALVVTAPAAEPPAPVYRQAAFLAHLIATKAHAPQTRERRRAEPSEAIAAYRAAGAMTRD